MKKMDYAIRNVICAEWNPLMDRCGVCPIRGGTMFALGVGQDGKCKNAQGEEVMLQGDGVQAGIADAKNGKKFCTQFCSILYVCIDSF